MFFFIFQVGHIIDEEVTGMTNKHNRDMHKEANVELGGMGLYGTTTNEELAGYQATGDIENAGHLEKGFKKEKGHQGATSSVKGTHQRGMK